MKFSSFLLLWILSAHVQVQLQHQVVDAFAVGSLFQERPAARITIPSKTSPDKEIELPDFVELFQRLQQVSPLAASVLQGKQPQPQPEQQQQQQDEIPSDKKKKRGFAAVDDTWPPDMKWKIVEQHNPTSKRFAALHQIAKIDHYNEEHAPLLRFRGTFHGPCIGGYFGDFMTVLDERKKWDTSIEQVYEAYPAADLDTVNIVMRQQLLRVEEENIISNTNHSIQQHGDCSKLGIGYCQTKASFGISSREQLTLCGVQDFPDGSCIIWGTECEPWHDALLPKTTPDHHHHHRHTRAKSNIFAATLVPTSDDTFDVEYSLQLDIGGRLPLWLTTPVVSETVKSLFRCASQYYQGKDGHLEAYLRKQQQEHDQTAFEQQSLLMTP